MPFITQRRSDGNMSTSVYNPLEDGIIQISSVPVQCKAMWLKTLAELVADFNNGDVVTLADWILGGNGIQVLSVSSHADVTGAKLAAVINNITTVEAASLVNDGRVTGAVMAKSLNEATISYANMESILDNITDPTAVYAEVNEARRAGLEETLDARTADDYRKVQLYRNMSYEANNFNVWTGTLWQIVATDPKHGTYHIYLPSQRNSSRKQQLYIPALKDGAKKLYLHYWYKRWKTKTWGGDASLKIDGATQAFSGDNVWHEVEFDLTGKEGTTIEIELRSGTWNTSDNDCYVRFDDAYIIERAP